MQQGDFLNQHMDTSQIDQYPEQQFQPQSVPQFGIPQRLAIDDKWQYELKEVLENVENFLRARIKDENGNYKQIGTPLMKDKGINFIIGDLNSRLHKGVFLSNLSKNDVCRLTRQYNEMIIDWLYLNWYEQDVDKSNFKRIIYNLDSMIFTALQRALDDGDRRHRSQMTSINESRVITQNPEKKRWGIL